MAATTRTQTAKNTPSRSVRKTERVRWNAFGLRREDRRDPAALTFARLGLLATRW